MEKEERLKTWTFRMPEALLDKLRIRAAKRTIIEGRNVSLNEVAVQALSETEKDSTN